MDGEPKCLQFKSLVTEKVSPYRKILNQPNHQDINRPCHTISFVIYGATIQKDASYRFQASLIDQHTGCHPTTQSPGKIQKVRIDVLDPPPYQHQE